MSTGCTAITQQITEIKNGKERTSSKRQKEQVVDQALVVAKVQQQKVVTLLAPTENKKPVSCKEAMPEVRAILKRLAQ